MANRKIASLWILLIITGLLLSAYMQVGAAADSSSSDWNEVAHSEGTRTYFGSGRVQVVFGPPDLQNRRVALDIVVDIQFPSNLSYAGVWVQVEDTVELPRFFLNKTSPTWVIGHTSASAYLSGSREAFPFDSYATEIKIHIFLGQLNITEPSVYWNAPGFMESRPIHRNINSTEYFTDIEIGQAIDRDPRPLWPIIMIMTFSPVAILAVFPLARARDPDEYSWRLSAIQPRVILSLTLLTASLTLFEVFRSLVPPAGLYGFFTFPEVTAIATIACGAIYLVTTFVWWSTRYGKLSHYDLLSSLVGVAVTLFLVNLLQTFIYEHSPLYAWKAFEGSTLFLLKARVLLAIAVFLPAGLAALSESRPLRPRANWPTSGARWVYGIAGILFGLNAGMLLYLEPAYSEFTLRVTFPFLYAGLAGIALGFGLNDRQIQGFLSRDSLTAATNAAFAVALFGVAAVTFLDLYVFNRLSLVVLPSVLSFVFLLATLGMCLLFIVFTRLHLKWAHQTGVTVEQRRQDASTQADQTGTRDMMAKVRDVPPRRKKRALQKKRKLRRV